MGTYLPKAHLSSSQFPHNHAPNQPRRENLNPGGLHGTVPPLRNTYIQYQSLFLHDGKNTQKKTTSKHYQKYKHRDGSMDPTAD